MAAVPTSSLLRRRGSVVVVVLALVALGAFFLTRFIERATTEMLVETRARQADALRADAYSALEATLAVLADYQAEDQGLRSPAQGWEDPLTAAGYAPRDGVTVAVAFEDESGKLSLPRLDQAALEELGRALGLRDYDAERFADALLGWTRREHLSSQYDSDPRNYRYENPPHDAPGRALESFDELAAIAVVRDLFYDQDRQPTELLGRFRQMVSLYDFASVNLNGIRPETLVLAGVDPSQVGRLEDFQAGKLGSRRGPRYFRTRAEAEAILGTSMPAGSFDTLIQVLRIKVTASAGGTALHLEAVIQPGSRNATAGAAGAGGPTTRAGGGAAPAGNTSAAASGALQYPFTVLSVAESVDLRPAPSL